MKLLLICVAVLVLALVVGRVFGWRNLGNGGPVVPRKIALLQGIDTPPLLRQSEPSQVLGIGQRLCRDYPGGAGELDPWLDWVEGYLTAVGGAGTAARPAMQAALATLCRAHPDWTLAQAAAALPEELRRAPLR